MNDLLKNSFSGKALKVGDSVTVSRETLVGFVENVYDKINTENATNRWIARAFDKCGLNPWNSDEQFSNHLEQLNESGVFAALSAAHEAETLNRIVQVRDGIE